MEEKRSTKTLGELRDSCRKLTNLFEAFKDAGDIIDELAIHESSAASRKTNLRHEINELEAIRDKAKGEAQRALRSRDAAVKGEKEAVDAAASKANTARTAAEQAHKKALGDMELEMKQALEKRDRQLRELSSQISELSASRDALKSEVTNAETRRKKLLADLGVTT